ncbi:ORF-112 [Buzura suppressaria nucleopolyhedrovirus]|uniref:ORF-112 n=1 Tax=Buzura suppressaria nuclear polyhedrosis virus TaxID=74320 RepID=W5VKN8_NPVBS|nr:ORF-112 [Buzura suppressaria nucleopolyhedrovirus]AHH82701.1 ORF-112 [Buzura suppressaria nucleopolyhedrovirus]AKN91085.1 ORF-115 [Buzura suppressaria nucleopolyhedrovirus]QYF10651.1 ac111-like [Buzura suppressaria nucleopolyhedrovirus]
MDSYLCNFYNNQRKPCKPTTLHDKNLPRATYEDIVNTRRLFCTEIQSNRKDDKFKTIGYNKENTGRH